MLCVLRLIVLWGFSLATSYTGVKDYKSIAKCAGKDYRDGAVVPFE